LKKRLNGRFFVCGGGVGEWIEICRNLGEGVEIQLINGRWWYIIIKVCIKIWFKFNA